MSKWAISTVLLDMGAQDLLEYFSWSIGCKQYGDRDNVARTTCCNATGYSANRFLRNVRFPIPVDPTAKQLKFSVLYVGLCMPNSLLMQILMCTVRN